MASNPIYVESEEEIPELIERLRQAPGSDLRIVLPSRSRLGQSRFNFQLLRSYSSRLGKTLSIVSADPAVQQMAEEAGFPAFAGVDQAAEGAAAGAAPPATALSATAAAGAGAAVSATGPASPRAATAAAVPAPAPAPAPVPRRIAVAPPPRAPSRVATEMRPGRALLYVGAGLVLVAGLVASVIYVPSARVTLVAQAAPFSQAVQVTAAPGGGPVKVRTASVQKSSGGSFKASGVKTVPGTVATGTVVYTNKCGSFGFSIKDGQRLRGAGGIQFAQKGTVTVEPGQSQSAPVVATSPGANGNLGPGQIFVIEGNSDSCLTVTNPAATSGGTDETKSTIVDQADIQAATTQLEADLRRQVQDDLNGQVQAGEKLADQVVFQALDYNADHKPGDEVSSFSATANLSGEGAFYNVSDLQKAYADALRAKVPAGKQLTDNPLKIDGQTVAASGGGHLTFKAGASSFLAPKIDFDQVKGRLVGRSVAGATSELKQLPVLSVDVQESPFKLPFMPLSGSRIEIRYVVQQGTAAAGTS